MHGETVRANELFRRLDRLSAVAYAFKFLDDDQVLVLYVDANRSVVVRLEGRRECLDR